MITIDITYNFNTTNTYKVNPEYLIPTNNQRNFFIFFKNL